MCPSLVCVLLRVLSFTHSEPPRGRDGLFVIEEHDSDLRTGVRDGNFDDDDTNRLPRLTSLAIGFILSRYGNRGSQIGEKVVRRHAHNVLRS